MFVTFYLGSMFPRVYAGKSLAEASIVVALKGLTGIKSLILHFYSKDLL